MFGLSFVEIAIVAVLALLLLGPDQLPGMAKTLGKGLRELRRATDDLKGTFEQEMSKLEREVDMAQRDQPAPAAAQTIHQPADPVSTSQLPQSWPGLQAGATIDASAVPLALDQLRQAGGDPGAQRARARASSVPQDPASARSAARFAAHARLLGAAPIEPAAAAPAAGTPSPLGTDSAAPNGYTAVTGPGFEPALATPAAAAAEGPAASEKKPGEP